MSEMTPEKLRGLAQEALTESWTYDSVIASASAWEADRARIHALEKNAKRALVGDGLCLVHGVYSVDEDNPDGDCKVCLLLARIEALEKAGSKLAAYVRGDEDCLDHIAVLSEWDAALAARGTVGGVPEHGEDHPVVIQGKGRMNMPNPGDEWAAGDIPDEPMSPSDLECYADILERPTKEGARMAREGMRKCAAQWRVERQFQPSPEELRRMADMLRACAFKWEQDIVDLVKNSIALKVREVERADKP